VPFVSLPLPGIILANGKGTSGGAVYGERGLTFNNCVFDSNEATVHGGAVMGGHLIEFDSCDFIDNSAKFAGGKRELASVTIFLRLALNRFYSSSSQKGALTSGAASLLPSCPDQRHRVGNYQKLPLLGQQGRDVRRPRSDA